MLREVSECGCADSFCVYAGLAFVPYAVYVLTAAPFLGALGTAVSVSFIVLVPLVFTDWLFYGRWTVCALIPYFTSGPPAYRRRCHHPVFMQLRAVKCQPLQHPTGILLAMRR